MTHDEPTLSGELDAFQGRLDKSLSTWPDEPELHTRANAVDQWPRPITPLTQDLILGPQERGLDDAFAAELGITRRSEPWTWMGAFYGWVTFNVETAAAMAEDMPGWSRRGVYADYFGVTEDPDAPPPPKSSVGPLRLAGIARKFMKATKTYAERSERLQEAAAEMLREDLVRVWADEPASALVERLRTHPAIHRAEKTPHVLASVISAAQLEQLTKSLKKLAGDEASMLIADSISGLGGIHLAEAGRAMARVARGELAREALLDEFGFRGTNEFELSARPWREDQVTLDRLIEAAGKAQDGAAAKRREAARARLKELAGWRWPMLRRKLDTLARHTRWRENGKVPMAMSAHSMRLVVREAGRRLAEQNRLESVDDVYFLRAAELEQELSGRPVAGLSERIARRRESHKLAHDLPLPEMIDVEPGRVRLITRERWRELGVLPPAELDAGDRRLTGVGGAPGVVSGRARIVADPNEVEIDEGDVLVAVGTDSAWTPLFLQAAAVVVDVGGIMSHCAIAAREVGIPCVVNVKAGTSRIAEGQVVTVDGDNGVVSFG